MLNYIIAVISVAALCTVWALFQIWMTKNNPDTVILKKGCSTCDNATCTEKKQ
jgi:hypothetical protein